MELLTTTLFRLLLGTALVVAGLLVVRDPATARSLVTRRRDADPGREPGDPAGSHDRTAGDEDGRARAVGGLLFVVGVLLLLGEDSPF